jgi:B-block binding subunit of TFIIIC
LVDPSRDRKLLERIWSWLTAIPDLLVGPDGGGQGLSLSQVEAREHQAKSSKDSSQTSQPLRLFTTEDRMWLAVAGHQKDIKLVPPFQFTILCIIAAAGENGITQPEIVRKSGQDKRSVPKRTDYLALHGYIEKRPVYVKAARTSLLVHKKFLKPRGNTDQLENPDSSPTKVFHGEQLDFNKFVAYLSDRLKDSKIMTEGDLMSELGLLVSMRWHREIVRKAIDKLVIAGIIDCFNAPSQIMTVHGLFRRLHCIKLLKIPTSADIKAAFAVNRSEIVAYRIQRQEEEAAQRRQNGEEVITENPTEADLEEENRFQNDNVQGGDDGDEEPLTIANGVMPSTVALSGSSLCSSLDIDSSLHYNAVYRLIKEAGSKGVVSSVSSLNRRLNHFLTTVGNQRCLVWSFLYSSCRCSIKRTL